MEIDRKLDTLLLNISENLPFFPNEALPPNIKVCSALVIG